MDKIKRAVDRVLKNPDYLPKQPKVKIKKADIFDLKKVNKKKKKIIVQYFIWIILLEIGK